MDKLIFKNIHDISIAIDCNECLCVINSYLGYLGHFCEWRTVEKLMRDWPLLNIFEINNTHTKIKIKKI